MKELLLAFLILSLLYWYFNIRSVNKCILFHPKCNYIQCADIINCPNTNIKSKILNKKIKI